MRALFLFLFLISCNAFSQITTRSENITEKRYEKPKKFDSLSNFTMQDRFIDYKQYLGYKIYYRPKSTRYKHDERERNFTDLFVDADGKYFTILDIEGRRVNDPNRQFQKLEDIKDDSYKDHAELSITLKDNTTNDTINWHVQSVHAITKYAFLLVPYFEKAKKDFAGQNVISRKEISGLADSKTGEAVSIRPDEKWFCEDLSLTDLSTSRYLEPVFYLTSQNRTVVMGIEKFRNSFLSEHRYLALKEEEKRAAAERLRIEKEDERKRAEENRKFRQACIGKYGAKYGSLIADNRVAIGMTKEMCRLAWGEPIDINRITMKGFAHEQWVYGFGTYLYFDNGLLYSIQD